uniref:BV/ODV-C42 n=1 Tax=Adoxophyes orana granulovirus TaxID=170617 RepID=A0A0A7V0Q2_GVAO|nr:BV/ODV-C42 [Adoxophyes orana granulovirus]
MSSAKTRLFLTIEKLKNAMEDTQMSYPFWEKFFPLLGNATTVTIDFNTLSDLINEAAETAEQLIMTRGGVMFSQYLQQQQTNGANVIASNTSSNNINRFITSRPVVENVNKIDTKKYYPSVEKLSTYFVSASISSTLYTVKDIVKLYLYLSHTPSYSPLFNLLEQILFKSQKDCIPNVPSDQATVILNCIRNLTSITNYRLDYDGLMLMLNNIRISLNNEIAMYPIVKVRDIISNLNAYDRETEPYKAYAEKFEMLVALKSSHHVVATDNKLSFNGNTIIINNTAASVERYCDINRMVFNSVNNIFINAVEMCASENVKFDVNNYNRKFVVLDRVRENVRNNFVERVAVGDIVSRKRTNTIPKTTTAINNINEEINNDKNNSRPVSVVVKKKKPFL